MSYEVIATLVLFFQYGIHLADLSTDQINKIQIIN